MQRGLIWPPFAILTHHAPLMVGCACCVSYALALTRHSRTLRAQIGHRFSGNVSKTLANRLLLWFGSPESIRISTVGRVAEWFKAPVLKTGKCKSLSS